MLVSGFTVAASAGKRSGDWLARDTAALSIGPIISSPFVLSSQPPAPVVATQLYRIPCLPERGDRP